MSKKGIRRKPKEFVLDCSVTMAWYFKDEATAHANAVRKALAHAHAMVPTLWPLEVVNILVVGERRQRSTEAEARKWLTYLKLLPIRVDAETPARAWSDVLQIARKYEISAYDAAYLELAIRLGLSLATLDAQLKQAANSAGVVEFQP
jgi:predicted nucleic acid-binding protein